MTEYVAAQKAISFDYDVSLEVVTRDDQKLTLAASGNVELARPDKSAPAGPAGLPISRPYSTARR
jgi:Predicted periplasmic protein